MSRRRSLITAVILMAVAGGAAGYIAAIHFGADELNSLTVAVAAAAIVAFPFTEGRG